MSTGMMKISELAKIYNYNELYTEKLLVDIPGLLSGIAVRSGLIF
jgi:hypothetical protein